MRTKRQLPFKNKIKIAAVVDGETEFWYLQMLKRNESDMPVDIKPEIPQKKKLSDQYKKVIELSKIYDKVLWIVDLDVILNESAVAKGSSLKALDIFLNYKKAIEEKEKDIIIVINQPCLEFWFLIHFEYTTQPFTNCENAGKLLKKYLDDYVKSEKYYTKQDNDIYMKLKAKLPNAIKNSNKFEPFDRNNPNNGLSEMFKLFEVLGIK